jgi:hypothetical protein
MRPGPKPIGDHAMTPAERQARRRALLASSGKTTPPKPKVVVRNPVDRRSRPQQWLDAVAVLVALQADYAAWLETIPENLRQSATAEILEEIVALDLSDLEGIAPPRGFGRDHATRSPPA